MRALHRRRARVQALLVSVTLSLLACRGQSAPPGRHGDPPATVAAKPLVQPTATPAPVRNVDLPAQPERVDHVTIDPRPRCGPALDEAKDSEHDAWLDTPEIQRSMFAVTTSLQGFASASIGTTVDHERRAVIVVFHTDFHDWARIRQRLVGRVAPLEVVLQPSCYPRAMLAEAEQLILAQAWHPDAMGIKMGFRLDASFSGYRVVIDDTKPEAAEALQQRLGKLVRVSLGKPGRN
jgi:hypothetical protein